MKLDYLSTLQSVIRTGSFAAAASEANLTPSAVSQRMQQLEVFFGRPLFDRSGREARPTPLAREVVATVVDALDGLEALRDRRTIAVSGRVRLGAIHSAQLASIPACLVKLRHRHPTLEVTLVTGFSEELINAVRAGKIDAAVVVRPDADVRGIRWCNLQKESFVQMPRLEPVLDAATASVIMGMVAAGLGFSVMPQAPTAMARVFGVHHTRLDRAIPPRQLALALSSSSSESRRVQALAASIQDAYEEARRSTDK